VADGRLCGVESVNVRELFSVLSAKRQKRKEEEEEIKGSHSV